MQNTWLWAQKQLWWWNLWPFCYVTVWNCTATWMKDVLNVTGLCKLEHVCSVLCFHDSQVVHLCKVCLNTMWQECCEVFVVVFFFSFGTNVLTMTWLYFSGQWSWSLWPPNTMFGPKLLAKIKYSLLLFNAIPQQQKGSVHQSHLCWIGGASLWIPQ